MTSSSASILSSYRSYRPFRAALFIGRRVHGYSSRNESVRTPLSHREAILKIGENR
jgi:hypothetical protein